MGPPLPKGVWIWGFLGLKLGYRDKLKVAVWHKLDHEILRIYLYRYFEILNLASYEKDKCQAKSLDLLLKIRSKSASGA